MIMKSLWYLIPHHISYSHLYTCMENVRMFLKQFCLPVLVSSWKRKPKKQWLWKNYIDPQIKSPHLSVAFFFALGRSAKGSSTQKSFHTYFSKMVVKFLHMIDEGFTYHVLKCHHPLRPRRAKNEWRPTFRLCLPEIQLSFI